MYTHELIENLLDQELQGLCVNCVNAPSCSYRMATEKVVIQCELFEMNSPAVYDAAPSRVSGLCTNCFKTTFCQLPGRNVGTWHCEEYA